MWQNVSLFNPGSTSKTTFELTVYSKSITQHNYLGIDMAFRAPGAARAVCGDE